jgi:hypothetical protein
MAAYRYEFDVAVDADRNTIAGTLKLTYQNDAGRQLDEVPMRGTAVTKRVVDESHRELTRRDLLIRLASPLGPGQQTVLLFEFESSFLAGDKGYRLVTGAWHPKAETFRESAFNPQQEQADTYDLSVTFPADEVLAVAGKRLQDEVLPDGRCLTSAQMGQN